jgi:formate dehydrogenase major subunit
VVPKIWHSVAWQQPLKKGEYMKTINRREFLQISGGTLAGIILSGCLGIDMIPIQESISGLRILHARQTTTICPYCAVGCGIIVHTVDGEVINTEGDPDHPINEGSLCSKGMALYQISHNNFNRLTQPLYRPPYGTEWKEVSWDFALEKIARRIKDTRDNTFETKNNQDRIVNRTLGMASLGSAALDNEECYIYQKLLRSLGIVYVEHQARI